MLGLEKRKIGLWPCHKIICKKSLTRRSIQEKNNNEEKDDHKGKHHQKRLPVLYLGFFLESIFCFYFRYLLRPLFHPIKKEKNVFKGFGFSENHLLV